MSYKNNPWLFVIVGFVILLVILQSVVFLVRALKRSKELNMDQTKLKKIIKATILFTIAPSFAIVVGMISLTKSLGLAIPWLRLSVAGSITYETSAAELALKGLNGDYTLNTALTESEFVTVFLVMSTGILIGLVLIPFITDKYQNGMIKLEQKDPKWSNILTNSLFIGMISAFVGFVFCDMTSVFQGVSLAGLLPVCVFFISAVCTVVCGICMKKFNWKWMGDYALPISLIIGMASAIPLSLILK